MVGDKEFVGEMEVVGVKVGVNVGAEVGSVVLPFVILLLLLLDFLPSLLLGERARRSRLRKVVAAEMSTAFLSTSAEAEDNNARVKVRDNSKRGSLFGSGMLLVCCLLTFAEKKMAEYVKAIMHR